MPQRNSPDPGIIKNWEISRPFLNSEINPYGYYDSHENLKWEKITSDEYGLVNLTKHSVRNMSQPGWIYCRTTIHSEEKALHKFQLGYSDYVSLFINGNPIITTTNAYMSRDPGFAGLIGYFDEIFLPLIKGKNEICLLVGEQFGGWGYMMRDGDAVRTVPGINKKWELKHQLDYPESVAYDPESDMLYVSNFLNNSGGGISKLSKNGELVELEWLDNLANPTGLVISNDIIYVVERTNVVIIDKVTATIISRIKLEGCIFPNDITISNEGVIFITDSEGNKIYTVKNDKASIWLKHEDLKNPNGIDYKDGSLYIGCSGDSKIRKINIESKKISVLASLPEGSIMDGLQVLDDGTILFSDFAGRLYHMDSHGLIYELINTVSTQENIADFIYIEDNDLLVIPGLYSNIIAAYLIKEL